MIIEKQQSGREPRWEQAEQAAVAADAAAAETSMGVTAQELQAAMENVRQTLKKAIKRMDELPGRDSDAYLGG